MSWLADIAGKAELFLNNIDQTANIALNAPEELGIGIRRNSKTWKAKEETVDSENVSSSTYVTTGQETINSSISNHTIVDKSTSNGAAQQQKQQQSFKNSNRSRSRSKQVTKQEDESLVQDSVTNNINTVKQSSSKILPNGSSATTTSNKKKSDEELLDFLNSPNQKEIDEVSLLKSEISQQAKETGLIMKNHKRLQQDYEAQKKLLEELQSKLVKPASQVDKEAENLQQLNQLNAEIKAKNEETGLLRQRLDEALEKLKSMDKLLNIQNRVEQLELENRQAGIKNTELEEKVQSLTFQLSGSEKQIQSTRDSLVNVEKEFNIYREKAKAILRTKDELIASIKDEKGRGGLTENSGSAATAFLTDAQIMAELTSLKNERELLHGEISQSRLFCDSLKEDNRRLESEIHSCRVTIIELQETVTKERDINHTIQEENLQFSQNVSALQLSLEREKSEKRKLDERLKKFTKDTEFTTASSSSAVTRSASGSPHEFVNHQVQFSSTPSSSSSSRMNLNQSPVPLLNTNSDIPDVTDNLKTRIKALTQSLLEKQGLINSISADKQLLHIRVERLQAQIQEMEEASESTSNSGLTQTVISSQPLYLSASPWDSNVARRVKRAYSRVDSLCCQFGLAMKQRPNLRLGFSTYILFLHMWVFFVLFYWSHNQAPIAQPYVHK